LKGLQEDLNFVSPRIGEVNILFKSRVSYELILQLIQQY